MRQRIARRRNAGKSSPDAGGDGSPRELGAGTEQWP